jgi:hypothetical protein
VSCDYSGERSHLGKSTKEEFPAEFPLTPPTSQFSDPSFGSTRKSPSIHTSFEQFFTTENSSTTILPPHPSSSKFSSKIPFSSLLPSLKINPSSSPKSLLCEGSSVVKENGKF